MRLNEMQRSFRDLMLDGPEALSGPPPAFAALFESGGADLSARLGIYRANIVGGLAEKVAAGYPLLESLTGREFLVSAARVFVAERPPAQGCLNLYGEEFGAFLRAFAPAGALPYLADVAAFESALTQAYHAPDDAPLEAQTFAALAPEALSGLVLRPRASATLLSSEFPVRAIREYCLQPEEDRPPALDVSAGGARLMVRRPGLEVLIDDLEEGECELLRRLFDGMPLGRALAGILEAYPVFDFPVFLERWVARGVFAAV